MTDIQPELKHGTLAAAKAHRCPCGPCRKASREYDQRYNARMYREGPVRITPDKIGSSILYAVTCGITYKEIGDAAGMVWECVWDIANGKRKTIYRQTQTRLVDALRKLAHERTECLADLSSSLVVAEGAERRSRAVWELKPLRDVCERRGLSMKGLLSDSERRQLFKSRAGLDVAERLCRHLGVLPEDVWDNWYESEGDL